MNIYRAVLRNGYNVLAQKFNTVGEAEQWILQNNNNMDSTSFIQEINPAGEVVDWFYYSEGKE